MTGLICPILSPLASPRGTFVVSHLCYHVSRLLLAGFMLCGPAIQHLIMMGDSTNFNTSSSFFLKASPKPLRWTQSAFAERCAQ
ncbi:hypothetical protein P692DRAFT_20924602 [Suillus brevipes Sb2]|nr:hypothetical protein P692DRAFT_20924602 [Suillus brevipes Sb2]